MDDGMQDICRVCRSEGTTDRPLFYPCVCTGSIKYIHQDCLTQWLRYSRKGYCELCNHRFSFTPIYAPDMPKRLPIRDVLSGLFSSVSTAVRFWLHCTLVALAWLGIVPLSACRIHRSLFSGSVNSVIALPLDMLSTENLLSDLLHGCLVVMCTLCVFISLVWLREHIMHGGGPDWLDGPIEEEPADIDVVDFVDDNQGGGEVVDGRAGVNNNNHDNNNVIIGQGDGANNNNNNNNNNINNVGGNVNINAAGAAAAPAAANPNPPPPAAAAQANAAAAAAGRAARNNDELNWNIEWDRAAEELTWERLLGLDGSLVFLEHVFWVVSLNTLFILLFEFTPYHIGQFIVDTFEMKDWTTVLHFESLITTLVGYVVIGIGLVLLHTICSLLRLRKCRKILGLCYVVVKVCLLSVIEIGLFPLACGWWLDICSLALFDASLKDRENNFKKAPGTSMFMHWLFGMIYVFYFATFILLMREVLRPGVLWFLRNLNDPDFNPIQEMIHLPMLRHIRRFLFSMIIFGTTILLMVWIPIRLIKRFKASFLPFVFTFTTESTHELSLELVLLQVMMPALLEQGHSRDWMKIIIRKWFAGMAWLLDLHSYLLGDGNENEGVDVDLDGGANENVDDNDDSGNEEGDDEYDEEPEPAPARPPPPPPAVVAVPPVRQQAAEQQNEEAAGGLFLLGGGGLGAAHQALLLRDGPVGFLPYKRPKYFYFKIVFLILSMCISVTLVSLAVLTLPVAIGRAIMSYWLQISEPIHDLYTIASGLYVTWLSVRLFLILSTWIPKGWSVIWNTTKRWTIMVVKTAVAMGLLVGLIPYMSGLLFELVVVAPIRVSLHQSPIFVSSDNWIMGTLYIKIACALTMMTPQNFWLRRTLERIYNDGIRNINLNFIMKELAAPLIMWLGLALAVPFVISQSIVPLFVTNLETLNLFERRIYPFFLVVASIYGIIYFQIRQFKKLYEHIKNDKYLVGRRLVNYERPPPPPPPPPVVIPVQQPAIDFPPPDDDGVALAAAH